MSSTRCQEAELPLCPLLCVSGAAAVAAGVYYYMKKRDNGEKRAKLEDKHLTEDSVPTLSLLDPAWKSDEATHSDSAVPEECRVLPEAEKRYEQAMECVFQLQEENIELKFQLDTLQDTVQELGNLLADTHAEFTDAKKLHERELNLRNFLQAENKQREKHFKQEVNSLRVLLNEAERKDEQVMESNTQLEIMNMKLWSDLRKLQDTLMEFDQELSLSCIKCNHFKHDLQAGALTHHTQVESHDHLQRDIHRLKCEVKKLRESVQMMERRLSESRRRSEEMKTTCLFEAEEKYEQELESNVQLENGNSDLLFQVESLKDTVRELCNLLVEKTRKFTEAERESSLVKAVLLFSQSENKRRRRVLIQKLKSLQDSVEEAYRKYELVASSNTQLEDEKFDLLAEVNILADQLSALQQQLSDAGRRFNQAVCELHRKDRDLEKLDFQWKLFNETVLKDYEVECLAHTALRVQYTEMREQRDRLLQEVQAVEQK